MNCSHRHRGKRVIIAALRDDDVEGFVIKERFYVCTAAIFYDRHTHTKPSSLSTHTQQALFYNL